MRKISLFTLLFCLAGHFVFGQFLSDFESLGLDQESVWDGSAATLGTFETTLKVENASFINTHTRSDWGYGITESWSGFAYSKVSDNTTPGYGNQFSCIAGEGASNSQNYGIVYTGMGHDRVEFDSIGVLSSIAVCNSTYAYYSMKDGDSFSKKFGGEEGSDPDFFLLKIIGYNFDDITDTIDFYLADYRFESNDDDYIIHEWSTIDLSTLGSINSIRFELSSSDQGNWGMNTPAYFCLDNLENIDFESLSFTSGDYWNGATAALGTYNSTFTDGKASFNNSYTLSDWGYGLTGSSASWSYSSMTDNTTPGYNNAYSAIAGHGADNSSTYAVCYNSFGQESLLLETPLYAKSLEITNGTYPYFSMKNGDSFAKKFGGETGDDPDFFLLHISGYLDGELTNTIDFYLADFRFEDNSLDYIIDSWKSVNLSSLGVVDRISFSLSSSDTGDWGMNTPAYFFIDNLKLSESSKVHNLITKGRINIYPNPAQEFFTITSEYPLEQINIFSIQGQILMTADCDKSLNNRQLSISDFPQGNYLIRIKTEKGTEIRQLIKN